MAEVVADLLRHLESGRQEHLRGPRRCELSCGGEKAPFPRLAEPLDGPKLPGLARGFELRDGFDAEMDIQGGNLLDAQARYTCELGRARGKVPAELFENAGGTGEMKIGDRPGQAGPDALQCGQPTLLDQATDVDIDALEHAGAALVRASLEGLPARQTEQAAHLPERSRDGQAIELFCHRRHAPSRNAA